MKYEVHFIIDAEQDLFEIYSQVIESNVFIHCVLDGRRDLQDLLQQRLLRE